MKILVINAGSSSLKYQLINKETDKVLIKGLIEGLGQETSKITYKFDKKEQSETINNSDHKKAIELALDSITKNKIIPDLNQISAIGHRVVHGGEKYSGAVLIDDDVINTIKELFELAPLHNPPNLQGIMACKKIFPKTPQVAVFDTAFHQTIPKKRFIYAIPYKYYEKNKIRKYGFHGSSFKYITNQIKKEKPEISKMIICHIGNGSSICAVEDGKSIDTSMGFTPLQGIIMGTRSGDIDATIVKEIEKIENLKGNDVLNILNKKSGLLGICNDSDMRNIWQRYQENDEKAILAMDSLSESITKYISFYNSLLNGAQAIIFTTGLGQNAHYLREKIMNNFKYLELNIDNEKNNNNEEIISTKDSKIKVMVIPTNEELQIANESSEIINQ